MHDPGTFEHESANCSHAVADDARSEPDCRFLLANERTFLAWQRTALGLLAASVGVVTIVPATSVPASRHIVGLILGGLAILTAGMGLRRWAQSDRAIRHSMPLPRQLGPAYLGLGVVIIGLVTLVLMVGAGVIG